MNIIWSDKKRNCLGFPWTFTTYTLSEGRLFIESGILIRTEKELRLHKLKEIYFSQTLLQRFFGLGDIHIKSDSSLGDFVLKNVFDVKEVKDEISHWANIHRKSRVRAITRLDSNEEEQ